LFSFSADFGFRGIAVQQIKPFCCGGNIFVSATGEVDDDDDVLRVLLGGGELLACEDSMAGMMPSVRQSSRNASIASLSVTGSYLARPMSER
jgi:hypothetical protein